MLTKIKDYFKNWNLFEKCFLGITLLFFVVLAFVFKQPLINVFYSITAIICAFLLAKGKWYGYIFGIVCISLYIYISYVNKYYGEALFHVAVTIPIYVIAIINWFKNQADKVVKVKKISVKEIVIFSLILISGSIGLYFLLLYLNTAQALISVFSVSMATVANYLAMRRSDLTFIAYTFDDIFIIILWSIPLIRGDLSLLNVAITMVAFLINDIYGVINWRRIKAKQSQANQINNEKG